MLFQISHEFPRTHKILVGAFAILLFSVLFGALAYYETAERYALTHLVPDTQPTPVMPVRGCHSLAETTSALIVFFGNGVVILVDKFPTTILGIGTDDNGKPYPVLRIDKSGDELSIDLLRIFDDHTAITTFHQSEIWKNSNFHVTRPSKHQLIAYDAEDREALNIHFLNKRTIRCLVIFSATD
jgi:hypothetical protein